MPDKETLEAMQACFGAVKALVSHLGPGWTLAYAVAGFFGIRWYLKRRDARADASWERTLQAKDDMIEQINEQNREFRVQLLVVANAFTKEEAVAMVYRKGSDAAVPVPTELPEKKR